ncbi:hypothetical protein JYT97_00060 [Haliea sp. AH-315-K21]|uniref:HTH cro/C1-type domain-containing protein n=1 Tax=SAR86 cluster bacterium TaxID=2030880 RepID=A0A2A5CF05_9GAMM|nr:hypothetical protein [Haliea sp. AH-315-K21]PCJ42098.1 MAG: hypothetical protein COA71_05765 [SAR86 cluster bacterium]
MSQAVNYSRVIDLLKMRYRINQDGLAYYLGVHPMTVSKWNHRKLFPSSFHAELLAELLRVSELDRFELSFPHPVMLSLLEFWRRVFVFSVEPGI